MVEYLSLKELSEYCSLSPSTLRSLIKAGELPCVRLQRKIIVKRSDFDYWAKRRQRQHQTVSPLVRKLADKILGVA